MRIIAGMAKGIPLATPTSDKTRPTSDRVKEAIFSALENHIDLDGTRVIDLFAGTGALGLEAISRGSISCTFVEKAQDMCRVIKTNIEKVEKAVSQYETMPPVFEVVNKEVSSVIQTLSLSKGKNLKFDVVFCDPPYDREFISLVDLIEADGIIVYETSKAKFEDLKKFLKDLDFIYAKSMSDTGVVIATLPTSN